jgi:fatty-acyl-CoA synthase
VVNYYGTTESGTITMVQGQDVIDHPDSVGRPVIGNRVRIVNEDGSIVPRGTSGRIRLASPMASLSNNGPGRAYTTTDLGMLDEQGWLYHLGRADDRERIGGEFINPRRIEEVLTSINGVESAHVWTTETQKGLRVAGTVTVQPGADLSPKTIQAVVRTRLGPASVPVTIEIERPSEGCD